jgi:hypothetical protein
MVTGLPQHFGIFYALGFALISEGILSACYHVCPTSENFQFDTTFMYVIAVLCFIKLYQFRHPDVSSNAYKVKKIENSIFTDSKLAAALVRHIFS